MTVAPERIETRLDEAIEAATARLLELQHPDGWWVGELESNATMIAQHLFWHHVLGLRTPELDRKIANELLARQRGDGTWAIWFDGPADLSTSIEAYAALRLAGVDPGPLAREYIQREGGVPRARVFTKCFLALLGQWPWQRIPTVPPELILLPPWGPLSVYDFSCWARQTIVPLAIVMLAALGHGFEDETLRRAVEGWEGFTIDEGDRLRPEACQSPVWDTALAVLGLRAAGVPADEPRLRAAGEWLLREEVTVKGDWAIQLPGLEPGGWAFEFENDVYPDVDDTAVVALALRELGIGDDAVRRGLDWMVGMQSLGGGWGAFDVDNEALWLYKLPICDFGKVPDEPTADVTAHALEVLGHESGYEGALAAGLNWLLAEQEDDGSWFGRWGVNHIYGTGAALPGLEACGIEPGHPSFRRAVAWLDSVQNEDGGFGEDIRSYADPAWRGRGPSTPSQTAWALLAYVAAGDAEGRAARRAAEWLCSEQRSNGDWEERQFTGTGFPLDFMIRYHLYRLHFPLLALGRLRERLSR